MTRARPTRIGQNPGASHGGGEKSRTENRARVSRVSELGALELQAVRLGLPPCTSEAATWSTLSWELDSWPAGHAAADGRRDRVGAGAIVGSARARSFTMIRCGLPGGVDW